MEPVVEITILLNTARDHAPPDEAFAHEFEHRPEHPVQPVFVFEHEQDDLLDLDLEDLALETADVLRDAVLHSQEQQPGEAYALGYLELGHRAPAPGDLVLIDPRDTEDPVMFLIVPGDDGDSLNVVRGPRRYHQIEEAPGARSWMADQATLDLVRFYFNDNPLRAVEAIVRLFVPTH
jgi:hypothetical protein